MLRAAVADCVRPLVDKIVEQLTDELVGHIELRLEHALKTARAALAQTELPWQLTEIRFVPDPAPAPKAAPDLVRSALGDELADMLTPAPAPAPAPEASDPSPILVTEPLAPPADDTPPSAGGDPAGSRRLGIAEVARILGVTAERVRQLDAQLEPERIGRTRTYDPDVVQRVLRERTKPSTTPAKDSAAEPPGIPPIPSRVARQPSPAPSPSYVPQAPVIGAPIRDLPRTKAAEERRERIRLRATPEALIARGVKATPEAQAAIVDARPVISTDLDDPQPIVPALPDPIATFVF